MINTLVVSEMYLIDGASRLMGLHRQILDVRVFF
jgi:hypothetical protein